MTSSTKAKLSSILNMPLRTQLPSVEELSRFGLRNVASGICSPRTNLFDFPVSARSSHGLGSLRIYSSSRVGLPLKLGNAEGVRPRPDANFPSLSMPSATWRFVLTCCRSISPA